MKNELLSVHIRRAWLLPTLSLLFVFTAPALVAQTNLNANGTTYTISYNGTYQDYLIPSSDSYSQLQLTCRGADGGRRRYSGFCTARGGEGATATATFNIGCDANELKPNSTIRFIVGHEGTKNDGGGVEGGGGGGGTAILYKEYGSSDWVILMVAGGGGGAFLNGLCDDNDGRGGTNTTSGSDGKGDGKGSGGVDGDGGGRGTGTDTRGAGGGGAYHDGDGIVNCGGEYGGGGQGFSEGGVGGFDNYDCGGGQSGGFGFGGGGQGIAAGGGGGGYSGGGGGGYQGGGGGGGSYVNSMAATSSITAGGTVANPDPGSCTYKFANNTGSPLTTIYPSCESLITVQIDNCPSGTLTVTGDELAGNTSGGCGDLTFNSFTFDCSQAGQTFTKTVTITDEVGTTASCTGQIKLESIPVALCKNITVNLNGSGSVTVNVSQINNSSYDPDGGTVSVGYFVLGGDDQNVTLHCSDIGNVNEALIVTDQEGQYSYCIATITVADIADPTVTCKNATVNLNSSGTGSITTSSVYQSGSDNCGTVNLESVSPSSFTCSNIGTQIVTLTANDSHGNTGTCTASVTVADNTAPSVTCKNATVTLNSSGTGTITTSSVYQTGSDNCGTVNLQSVSPSSFTCSNIGTNTVTLTVNDSHGNTKTCTATVTVSDNTAPTVTCKNATVNLSSGGTGSITTSSVYNSGSDNCGTVNQQSVSPSSFTCSNIGTNTVTLTVNDSHGNTATCTATVTVADNTAPTVTCKSATVNLNSSGTGSITTSSVYNSGSDNCGTVNQVSVSPSSFTCSNIGANTVTLTVNDGHGNTATCTATVTVSDPTAACNASPTAVCKNVTVNADASCTAVVAATAVDNGSSDPEGGSLTYAISPAGPFSFGTTTVTLTVTDNAAHTSSCTATITVSDNTAPTVTCKNATVNLNSSGTGSITTSSVYNSGSDNCGTVNQQSVSPSSFTCSNIGTNTVTLTVNDGHGNTATCTATVTVADNIAPAVACVTSKSVNLNASGTYTFSNSELIQSSSDNCGSVSVSSISPSSVNCNNLMSTPTVTVTVSDGHGNTATCQVSVLVFDNTPPSLICKNTTAYLDAGGQASISFNDVVQSVSDNCSIIFQQAIPNSFDCTNTGSNTVTVYAGDNGGNLVNCSATVTVADNTAPSVTCKNATVNLDASGSGSITTASVYNSGSDNCGTVNQVSVSPSSFTCSNLGTNIVTLTVDDSHGNTTTCTATVTVADNIAPTVTCKNATVALSATGTASITAADVFQSGSDNCGTASPASVSPAAFTCSNWGTNTVTLTAQDGHGNTSTCTATVTVTDNIAPTITCTNATVYLNSSGTGGIPATLILQSYSDNCTASIISSSPNTVDCSNIGTNVITLTGNDTHGNISTCTAIVTVVDAIAPSVTCKNATVNLDASGAGSITTADVYNSGSDNCGTVNQVSVSPSSFTCSNIGTNIVTLTVDDSHGNTATCTATVTVTDNIAPIVTCKNATVALSATGTASITAADVFQSGSDNCGTTSPMSVSPAAFTCSNWGTNTVTLTAQDGHGNTSTCTATITVTDNIAPTITCTNAMVFLNSSGTGGIPATLILQSYSDNCTASIISSSPNTVDCSNIGTNVITLTGNDTHGNISTCTAIVTVVDAIAPSVTCKNATVNLDATGSGSITTADVYNSGSDNCGTVNQQSVSPSSFTCSNIGTNIVTLTVDDSHGNTATCTATVTVQDVTAPIIACRDNLYVLDANNMVIIDPYDVLDDWSDNCGSIGSISASPDTFNCSGLGSNIVTVTVIDTHGNASTCTSSVGILDRTPPTVVCKNFTSYVTATGYAFVSPADVYQSGSDNCGTFVPQMAIPTNFNCSFLGENIVTLTVSDNNGNSATCTATVTVVDNIAPSVVCKNATVNLNAAGTGSITTASVFQSASDNCGTVSQVSVSPNSFTCSNLGTNIVTLTVNDSHGNTATCTATVTVQDVTAPSVTCKNATVNLGAAGTGSITTADVFQSASDNCGTVNQVSVFPNSFFCSIIGTNTVTLTVNDGHGNTATCTATVTVQDVTAPIISCKNATVNLDGSGEAIVTANSITQSISENCAGYLSFASPNIVNCGNLGANIVTLSVTDGSNNTSTCTAIVTVVDAISPTVTCKNATVNLGASGSGTITTASVYNSGSDNCGTVNQVSVSPSSFTCSNLGTNIVTLTVNDGHGNTNSCTATVTVQDATAPSVVCKNATVNLDASGAGSITTSSVYQSGSDNCGTVNQVSVFPNAFNCNDLGTNSVILTVNDGHGNTSTCTATVTVQDVIAPVISCKNATVNLNGSGSAVITPGSITQSKSDNCAGTISGASPATLNCSNIGTNIVTLTVSDWSGNSATCTATVTVQDVTAPTVACQNATVNLDASGAGSITTASVFQSGSDNCGTVNQQSVSPNAFTCSNLGANTVTLTANDGHGNTNTCTATVTVQDVTAPSVVCKNATVNLDASGAGSITTASVYQSGSDNCGTVNQQSVSPGAFTCSNLGANTVTLTVNDGHGNTNTCTATVTVSDAIAPSVVCKNATVNLDASGSGSITTASVFQSGSDNCGTVNQVSVSPNSFTCSNLGANTVTLTVNDGHGNTNTCTATVTVSDAIAPSVVCKNATVNLNASGSGSITTASVFQSGSDNCGTVNQVSVSPSAFTCSNLGANTVTLTVNDGHGNTNTCTATVTVSDAIAPSVVCKNATVNLDASGSGSITTASVFQSGSDNCGTVNQQSVSPGAFTCSNLGTNTVTLTVNDGHGNTNACTASVTVVDNMAPTVVCKNATVSLDAAGTGSITTAGVFQSGSDNCGTVNQVSVSPNAFTCSNLGANTVTLTVNDGHGNTSTCMATVSVVDAIVPTMLCKNATLNLDASGQATLTVTQINNGSYDNCSIASLSLSQSTFSCANIGDNTVFLNGADQSGNKAACTATVTVKDVTAPVAKCKSITTNLGSTGTVTVAASAINNNSTDNCSFTLLLTPASFSCANIGNNTVTLKATDAGGNTATCIAVVTVKDVSAPTALCKSANVYLNASGLGTLSAGDVNNGSSDNCSITSMSINTAQFNCSDLSSSPYYVTLTVKDGSNNTATCIAQVTVKDNLAPTAVCANTTVSLSSSGTVSVATAPLAAASYDNCSVWSYSPVAKVYTTANIGVNNLTITVKDWSGNAASCVSQVTVVPYGSSGLVGNDNHDALDDPGETADGDQAETRAERQEQENLDLQLSPNPSMGDVLVQFQLPVDRSFDLRVFDLSGRLLLHRETQGVEGNNALQLDLSRLAAGMYLIEVYSGQSWAQKRLLIQKD